MSDRYHSSSAPVLFLMINMPCCVSDPDPVGSAFNLGLDPDPYSESGAGCLKKKVKKLKFTMIHENRKML